MAGGDKLAPTWGNRVKEIHRVCYKWILTPKQQTLFSWLFYHLSTSAAQSFSLNFSFLNPIDAICINATALNSATFKGK